MFKRQTTGSVVCVGCVYLVGVNDERCYNCGRRNPGLWGYAGAIKRLGNDLGFTPLVVTICAVMFGITLLMSHGNVGMNGIFNFLSPHPIALVQAGASGQIPVIAMGRYWTVLSAMWLHGSLLHIFLNMWFLRQIAPTVGEFYGPGRTVVIYTLAGVVSFAVSTCAAYFGLPLAGGGLTVGASGAIFGLLGAMLYYGRRTGASHIRSAIMPTILLNFVIGVSMPGIDNYAHLGGLAGGWVISAVLDPLKPERPMHMVAALVCLALSIGSLILSLLVPTGLPPL
jgi:rhomboid protease GluP